MSDKHKKRKKSRRDEDDYADVPKKSLVDYSKVSARPGAAPRRTGPAEDPASSRAAPAAAAAAPAKMSQMEAVVRLMAGVEERTIAQKLADSNRPTWEQYKKDNEDKLNLEGVDQKQMEEYRQELDKERDTRLARGTNHGKSKKKKKRSKDDDSSSSDDEDRKRSRKKKHKKKKDRKKRKHRHKDSDDSDSDSSESENDRKKKKRKKKKRSKKDDNSGDDSDGSHYRLSKFFNGESDSEGWCVDPMSDRLIDFAADEWTNDRSDAQFVRNGLPSNGTKIGCPLWTVHSG